MGKKQAIWLGLWLGFLLTGCEQHTRTVELRIIETSDLHSHMMDYNYYQDKIDPTVGLVRASTLIKQARGEVNNSVLVDNGDLLQGSSLGDMVAHTFKQSQSLQGIHPVYQAMNSLDYAVGNIGNHEFNYGLDFLMQATKGANFPYINANVYCAQPRCANGTQAQQNLFTPYLIQPTQVVDNQGQPHVIQIGYIGFVPPQIVQWDKAHLSGRVEVKDIIETAQHFIPKMRQAGADLIVAIPHSGLGDVVGEGERMDENRTFALSRVKGIDAILFGHSHSLFPSEQFAHIEGVNIAQGTLNGVAAVMPGRWGDNIGIIDLTLTEQDGQWKVANSRSEARAIFKGAKETPPNLAMRHLLVDAHKQTQAYVNQPIGYSNTEFASYLSLIQDEAIEEVVAQAQLEKVKAALKPFAQYRELPILSAVAPFKSGGRHATEADSQQYIHINRGELAFRSAADIYLYPNTVVALKVSGKEVRAWLECSANMFNQIDPSSGEAQSLINWGGHRTFNFDLIKGVSYQIDVTQPSLYDGDCQATNIATDQARQGRIRQLAYQIEGGAQLTEAQFDKQSFIVATNNYRAFSNQFPGANAANVVLELSDENRTVVAEFLQNLTQRDGAVSVQPSHNWSLAPIATEQTLLIEFETSNSKQAREYILEHSRYPMAYLGEDALGFARYSIDLVEKSAR